MKQIRVRIAPSPTGYPHIGTIYQALFNFAFAKGNNGKFIIRIEDTDRQRFVDDAEEKLYEALDWLGLSEDESCRKAGLYGPYRQSERLSLYKKYAKQLIKEDHAYYCFCSKDRLEEMRKKLMEEKKPLMYDKHCLTIPKDKAQKSAEESLTWVIRLKVPENKELIVRDEIRGDITFNTASIDDQVLLKSDGFPTYHLAVVVDDHFMQISHVVRGEEWLTSLPKHILLYNFLGFEKPLFYHTATLRNLDKSKLSKRDGHTNISWYKEEGYLPQAILNFLTLLGWSHPEEKEIFALEEFISLFDLKNIKPVPPIFDIKKLEWMNGIYIREMDPKKLQEKLLEFDRSLQSVGKDILEKLVILAQSRINTLKDFSSLIRPVIQDSVLPSGFSDKELARLLLQKFEAIFEWESEKLFVVMKELMQEKKIRMPVLYTLFTGKPQGLPLPELLCILGKEKTLKRIKQMIT